MLQIPLAGRARLAFPTLLLVVALAGCTAAERTTMVRDATRTASTAATSGGNAGMITTTAASWSTSATEYRGRSGTFDFDCPSGGTRHTVWGSGPYTDDSTVCTAGVHAGVITFERGGRVRIQPRPGQNRYPGSSRNGVTTSDYPEYGGSFVVVN